MIGRKAASKALDLLYSPMVWVPLDLFIAYFQFLILITHVLGLFSTVGL